MTKNNLIIISQNEFFCTLARKFEGDKMNLNNLTGEMTEWFKVHAWKVCVSRESEPRVRIPLSPQRMRQL